MSASALGEVNVSRGKGVGDHSVGWFFVFPAAAFQSVRHRLLCSDGGSRRYIAPRQPCSGKLCQRRRPPSLTPRTVPLRRPICVTATPHDAVTRLQICFHRCSVCSNMHARGISTDILVACLSCSGKRPLESPYELLIVHVRITSQLHSLIVPYTNLFTALHGDTNELATGRN